METNYETAIKELEAEVERLNSKADGLKYAIETLKSLGGNAPEKEASSIKTNGSFKTNLFNEIDATVTPSERKELVYQAVIQLGRYSKIKAVVAHLGNKFDAPQVRLSLINLYEEKRIDKIKVTTSNEDTFYGLPEWKDGEKIKSERLYERTQVVGTTML